MAHPMRGGGQSASSSWTRAGRGGATAEAIQVVERWGRERTEDRLENVLGTPRGSYSPSISERQGQLREQQSKSRVHSAVLDNRLLNPLGQSWYRERLREGSVQAAVSEAAGATANEGFRPPNVELIFDHVGHFGRFQKVLCFICAFQIISCGIHFLASVFIISTPSFICKPPGTVSRVFYHNGSSDTFQSLFSQSIKDFVSVELENGEIWELSDCGRVHWTDFDLGLKFMSRGTSINLACPDGFFYNQSDGKSSVVTEWDLVCDQKHLAQIIQPVFMFGVLIGAILFGYLADRLGRGFILWPTSIAMILFGILTAFSVDIINFFIVYFFLAMVSSGFLVVASVYVVEFTGMKYRLRAAIFLQSFFALGIMIVAFVGYRIRTWRLYQIILSLVSSPFFLCCWILPETPFWLLAEGKRKEAQEVVDKMAKWNGKPPCKLSEIFLLDLNNPVANKSMRKSHSILDLFYNCNVGLVTSVTLLIWFTASLGFYCFSLMCIDLAGNKYLHVFFAGFVEFPAYILLTLGTEIMGGKNVLLLFLFLNSVTCGIMVIPMSNYYARLVAVLMAKMTIAAVFALIYFYTAGMYPTSIRALAVGSGSMVSRLGSIVAPLYARFFKFWLLEPQFLVMILTLLSALLSLVLPETFKMPLASTWEESPILNKGQKNSSKDSVLKSSNTELEESNN